MAARSISSTARCRRRRSAVGVSVPVARCAVRMARVRMASGASGACCACGCGGVCAGGCDGWSAGAGAVAGGAMLIAGDGASLAWVWEGSVAAKAAPTPADEASGSSVVCGSVAAASARASGTRVAARARRSRIRRRSSWVAASVKVTARIWPMRSCRSTTSRVNSVARVKVLPVPALASIRRTPCSGRCRYGSVTGLLLIRRRPARHATGANSRSRARDPAVPARCRVRAARTADDWCGRSQRTAAHRRTGRGHG